MTTLTGNTGQRLPVGLAVLCVAQFVVVLDATIVATALPSIGVALGFPAAQVSWVVTAYTVVLAGLLILGGRVADLVGARRMFQVGLIVFSVASLACALAWTPGVLVGARAAQAVGAALLSPAALASLSDLVDGTEARGRALGWWTAAAAGGGASGWVLGGLITELVGWRWVFAVNDPIGLVALVVGRRSLRPTARPAPRPRPGTLDLVGAAAVTAALALACLGCTLLGVDRRATPGWVAAGMAVVAFLAFVRHERRIRDPLVPGPLLRTPGVAVGNLTAAALTGSTTPAMLAAVLYVQQVAGLSPARGSLLFPAFNLAVIGGSLAGPRLIARTTTRTVLLAGFGCVDLGIALLLLLPADGLPVALLGIAFAVMGAGLGAASVASTTVGTAEVPPDRRGVAAGLLNSTAQLGQALSLAAIFPLVAVAAPMTGYRLAFVAAMLVGLCGAAAAFRAQVRHAEEVPGPPALHGTTSRASDASRRPRLTE